MENTYFVTYKLFNGETNGWAYKFELKTNDLEQAKRKYHELLSTYIDKYPYTHISIALTDAFDNVLMKEYWQKEIPQPEEELEEVTASA